MKVPVISLSSGRWVIKIVGGKCRLRSGEWKQILPSGESDAIFMVHRTFSGVQLFISRRIQNSSRVFFSLYVCSFSQRMKNFVNGYMINKVNSLNFSRFFQRCSSCRHRSSCASVATRLICTARWRRDKFRKNRITIASKKSLSLLRLNIVRCGTGLPVSFTEWV